MKRLGVIVCLLCVALTQPQVLSPRGNRPVEHGTRSEKCASEKEWPFCTDDDWGPKCPSGCRIQGLMDKADHSLLKKVEKIRSLLDQNKAKHRQADQGSKQTYTYLRERLILDSGSDRSYYDLANSLRQRITDMKIKIDRQLRVLAAMKERVKDQVVEMHRMEVDIDIKLRSCKGSCKSHVDYQVDRESYEALDKQINQLNSQVAQESVGTLYVMKSRPLREHNVDSVFKSKDAPVAGQQKQDVFSEVNTAELILEDEGSHSSPATISKVPACVRLKPQSQDGRRRPSHSGTSRKQRCRATAAAALCSDDDWVSKCPSGCRLQAAISQMDSELQRKLRTACKTAKMYEDAEETSMMATAHIYNHNRRVIVNRHVSERRFVEQAEGLTGNLTALRKRRSELSQQLQRLIRDVQAQTEDLYRTEVDVDMKLRACRGSCRLASPFSVNHLGYRTLQSDVERVDDALSLGGKAAGSQRPLPRLRLQPVAVGPAPPAEYKTIPAVQRELLTQFEDIGQNQVVLEELE